MCGEILRLRGKAYLLQAEQDLHLSILRELQYRKKIGGNILVFANKTKDDIILESELKCLLGDSFINILSDENTEGYAHGFITEDFLEANVPLHYKNYYLCGPPLMMESIISQLLNLGIRKDLITMEKMYEYSKFIKELNSENENNSNFCLHT